MSDLVKMLFQAEVDPRAVNNIHKQIQSISDNAKAIKIKIDVDDTVLKSISSINQKLQTQMKDIKMPQIDMTSSVGQMDKFSYITKKVAGDVEKLSKVVKDMSISSAESIKVVDTYNVKTGDLAHTTETLTANYKKQRQELEKIALFRQKMLSDNGLKGEMDIFAGKYKGKFNTSVFDDIKNEVENLQNLPLEQQTTRMRELNVQWNNLRQTAMQSGSVITRTIENMGKFMRFYLAGGVLVGFVKEIRDGIQSVKDLDKSLIELNKISEMSSTQLKLFTDRAYEAGATLARTGKEVVDATVEFRRAGYEMEQAFLLGQKALLLTNVGSGIKDVTEASSSLIAILKGFKLEAQDTAHVIDALNEVSNNYALDTVNLTEIMKRTAGTLSQTGTSFEELLGLSVGGFESLRNAEQVASGINMISQRLRGMAEDGSRVEGLIPKIQEAFDKYTKGAVSVIDKQNGGLHSTYEILSQLQEIYPTLSDEARAYINEAVAGNRQNKVLVAILENWENVESAIKSANNSLGSATKSNEAYLDSIEGKSSRLRSSLQLLWKDIINSDAIKAWIDGLNTFVNILDTLVTNSVTNFTMKVLILSSAIVFLTTKLQLLAGTTIAIKVISMFKLMTDGAIGFSMGIGILNKALLASPLFKVALIVGSVMLIVKAIDSLTTSLKEQKEKVDALSSSIGELQLEYDRLTSIENRTEEQDTYLKLIEKELEHKQKLLAIEKERAIQQEFFDKKGSGLDYTGYYSGSSKDEKTGADKIKQSVEELKILQSELKNIDTAQEGSKKKWDEINEKILKIKLSLGENLKELVSGIETLKNTQKLDPSIVIPQEWTDLVDIIKAVIIEEDSLIESTENLNDTLDDASGISSELTKIYEDITDKLINYNKILQEVNSKEGLSGATKDQIIRKHQELIPYLKDEGELRKQLIRIIGEEEKAQKDAYYNMIASTEEYLHMKIDGNKTLVQKLGEYYDMDLSNAKNLAEAKLQVEETLIKALAEQWSHYMNAKTEAYTQDYLMMETLAQQGNQHAKDNLQAFHDAVWKAKNVENTFKNIVLDLFQPDFKSINLSGNKDVKKEKDKYTALADATLKYRNAIEEVNHQLSILKSQQNLETDDLNKITLLQKQNELLKQQQVNYHNLANAHRAERDALEKSLAKQGFKFAGEGDNRMITNLDNIKGKSKEVEEQFKRYIDIQVKELSSAKQSWWNLQEAIKGVDIEMEKLQVNELFKMSNKGIEELNKELEMLDFRLKLLDENDTGQKFDLMSEKIQKAEFQVRFLADELQRLKAVGFEGSIEAVEEYNKQLDNLEKKHMDAQLFLKSLTDSYDSDYKKVMGERERIADDTIRTIKNAYTKQRELVINSLKEELRAEEDAHKRRIGYLDERLKKYEEIIKAQLDVIDRQEDEDGFNKELTKTQEERAETKRQIDILSMDDSLEARARVSELNKQLTEQDERIEEMKHKRTVDLRKQNLNDQLNTYRKEIEEKKLAEDQKLERTKERIDHEIQLEEWKYDKLINDEQHYADLREDIIDGNLDNIQDSLQGFLDEFDNYNKRTVQSIDSSWQSLLNTIREIEMAQGNLSNMPSKPKSSGGSGSSSSSGSSSKNTSDLNLGRGAATGDQAIANEDRLKNDPEFWQSEIARTQEVIKDRRSIGLDTTLQDNYLKRLITGSYDKGGKITQTGLAMVHGSKSEPEYVFNYDQFKDLAKLVANYQHKPITPKIPEISRGIELKIDRLINIEGNATKETIPELNKAGKNILADLQKQLNKNGVLRGVTG